MHGKILPRSLLIMLVAISLMTIGIEQTHAQNDDDCDPEAVNEWLMQRQAWRNATTETIDKAVEANLSWNALPSLLKEFNRHMQAIADLERPECANEVMLWTYYRYSAFEQFWICLSQGDTDCELEMRERLTLYENQVSEALAPLEEVAGIPSGSYFEVFGDRRPDDWSWPPETLREYFPASYTDGMLDFEGTGDLVSDPVTIPEGIYRVSLETEDDRLSLEMVVLAGECYVGNSSWDTTVFSFKGGGAQSLITSEDECDVMWQVENADAPFQISFEIIR